MSDRINPPHPQPGPVAFIGICLFGVTLSVRAMLELRPATEPWWAAVFLLFLTIGGFIFIIGGWLFVQRELDFERDDIHVRRWLDTLAGRPGRVMPIDVGTRSAITLVNVRSLRLEHERTAPIQFTLGYWDPRQIRRLVEALRARSIPLAQYWEGDYPPGTG